MEGFENRIQMVRSKNASAKRPSYFAGTTALIQGTVYRLGEGLTHKWSERFFILSEGIMRYYDKEDEKSRVLKGEIEVRNILYAAIFKDGLSLYKRDHCFELICKHKRLLLSSQSHLESAKWVDALNKSGFLSLSFYISIYIYISFSKEMEKGN